MTDEAPLGHVHCRSCGREMRPGGLICPRCEALGIRFPALTAEVPAPAPVVEGPPIPAPAAPLSAPLHARGLAPGFGRPRPAVHRGHRPEGRSLLPAVPAPAAPLSPVAPEIPARLPPVPAAVPVTAAPPAPRPRRRFRPIDLWRRYLPPVRLVWISLGILVAYGGGFVSSARASPLLLVPLVGILTDLLFQRVRFPRLRVPDAAIATSLFLALIIWPTDVSLPLLSIVVASVGLRHFVRSGGHPWLNPAAAGLALATILFALPTSWHVGLTLEETVLVAALGGLLMVRAPHAWRIPVFYFATYLTLVVAFAFALGAGAHWTQSLLLEGLSGESVFFGFFMVTEPRTAPSARWAMAAFGILVGIVSAGFPVLFTEVPVLNALGVIAPFLALFTGNLFTLVLPSARGVQRSAPVAATAVAG